MRILDHERLTVQGDRADDPGTWGLLLDEGFVQVADAVGRDGTWWTRPYRLLDGRAPVPAEQQDRRTATRRRTRSPRAPADDRRPPRERRRRGRDRRQQDRPPPWPVRATSTPFGWPDDPQVLARECAASLRIDGVRSGGHTLPVWILTPERATSTTWVVGVHGRGSPRTELFRIAATALRRGHPVLVASYRTDAWTSSPAPTTTLGTVEWRDAEANVASALAQGAERVVLAGCSLGGGLVAQVVRRSDLAPWIAGVVLDSPALSWGRLLRSLARRNRVPVAIVAPVMLAARLTAAVDWSMLDHLEAADEFDQPVLLLHGEEDDVVPIVLSEALATARPEIVTFERFPRATHVTSWNHAPRRYERAVERFLAHVDTGTG